MSYLKHILNEINWTVKQWWSGKSVFFILFWIKFQMIHLYILVQVPHQLTFYNIFMRNKYEIIYLSSSSLIKSNVRWFYRKFAWIYNFKFWVEQIIYYGFMTMLFFAKHFLENKSALKLIFRQRQVILQSYQNHNIHNGSQSRKT